MRVLADTPIPIKVWADDIKGEAETQLRNLATLPFIHKHVAVMPDAHAGRGSTVGTVIPTKGAIIPSAVGVDIGCGMMAAKLPFQIDVFDRLPELRHSIERSIPLGHNENRDIRGSVKDWFEANGTPICDRYNRWDKLGKAMKQLGSLGGGNHFIEICHDEHNGAWVVLHSGSRNIGKELADIHINNAKGMMRRLFITLPDPDLAYLAQGTDEFKNYIHDLKWAQEYAKENRRQMMNHILMDIAFHLHDNAAVKPDMVINCHHNYTQMENHFGENVWVTRKGAVSARKDEWGIIPGSMGAKSYIVRGLGNEQSFMSCSHGAGRRMSRKKARETFTEADMLKQTEGVECRKDAGVIDEIPASYKDIDKVMENQADLVQPVFTLKQILCVKG